MRIGDGDHAYRWQEDWANIPHSESGADFFRGQESVVLVDQLPVEEVLRPRSDWPNS